MAQRPEIILVGVVHGDPAGYEVLRRFFHREQPRVISVEISEYSWRYRRSWEKRWQRQFERTRQTLPVAQRRHLALERVGAQITCPFEVKAAAEYARAHAVPWLAVDLGGVGREHLPRYEAELLSPENLQALTLTPDGDWREHIRQEYQQARRVWAAGWGSGSEMLAGVVSPQTSLREKVLAHRVARLAKQWLQVVHVGGWEHLVMAGPRKTMADFLTARQPRLVLLDDL